MPEGPEVEICVRQLGDALTGLTVTDVTVGDPHATAAQQLEGAVVCSVSRNGKWLAVNTPDRSPLWIHLGMSGRLELSPPQDMAYKHVRAAWRFTNGTTLTMVDPRRFGRLRASDDWVDRPPGVITGVDLFGPAIESTSTELEGQGSSVKSLLLSGRVVAGVGNYLADEALFDAGVAPQATGLTGDQAQRVLRAVRGFATVSLDAGGMTMRDWWAPDGTRGRTIELLRAHRRGGQPCVCCGTLLLVAKVAGRTTTWCPVCQPHV